jgi:hypothetical protein
VILLPEQDVLSTTPLGGNSSATGSPGFFIYSRFNIDQREIAPEVISFAIVLHLLILFV